MLLIPSYKSKQKEQGIRAIADPAVFHLPLHTYRHTMQTVVTTGTWVKKYQLLAQSEGLFATTLHAPASGTIMGITHINDQPVLLLKNDYNNDTLPTTKIDHTQLTHEALIDVLFNYGIEGSGGARFPVHLKYRSATAIDTFIINGAECEPYLSADYVLMEQHTDDLMQALNILQPFIRPKRFVFGIEKQNRELQSIINNSAKKYQLPVQIKLLPDEYPQGGELQLIKSITGKELPKGCIPAEHGIVVNNVGTLWAIHQAFSKGTPYVERVVTVAGNGSVHQGNYYVKIGTPVEHILQETQPNYVSEDHSIILGGPMMGKAVHDLQTPVHKGSGGVLILSNIKSNSYNCIKCGDCIDACPQHLMPLEFVRYNDAEQLKAFHLQDCIECGACAYACPSEVPLMQHIISGKKKLS